MCLRVVEDDASIQCRGYVYPNALVHSPLAGVYPSSFESILYLKKS